jgi:energy-coupling factor transporter ATP-binding protein EcfA2
MSTPPLRRTIRIRSVSRAYRAGAGSCTAEVNALDGATLEIRGGEVLVVAGPRGSGKTTLLLCAAGLLRCDSGMIDAGLPVMYRDLSRPESSLDWPEDAAIFLDSIDRSPAEVRGLLPDRVQSALTNRCAIVLAGREAADCLSLAPPDSTIAIVHLRLGRIAPSGVAAFHRVAEGTSQVKRR